ncbi:purine nucleoside permease [Agaribacter marinus]|uniref:Lipoprotein n=1 Tax=Agaribacter marinus TaxID=1431249 RepID=A0AA37SV56_9ALTE|nr:purine nucleoside permease [Agaribacter marinus]GLR69129.1 lipoprotein [Agaribacter marinus]
MIRFQLLRKLTLFMLCTLLLVNALQAATSAPLSTASPQPVEVKVFIAAMFEIGENSGDKPGEFQFWYERYFAETSNTFSIDVPGALNKVFCNEDGICGSVLGMGKVGSSSSLQAILLHPGLQFNNAYFLLSGVAGTPPSKGTIGDVSIATYVIDYDLGHRWAKGEVPDGQPLFMPRKGYEAIRCYAMPITLTKLAKNVISNVKLEDDPTAKAYRQRYGSAQSNKTPSVIFGTHVTGDTFFHGPGLSNEAQYISELYQTDDYVITEMEASALMQVLSRHQLEHRAISLRAAVNFDQGHSEESTLAHLDPAPGETAGGFVQSLRNMYVVGEAMTDALSKNWTHWKTLSPEQLMQKGAATTACKIDTSKLVKQ